MPRQFRININNGYYHVFNRGANRYSIFETDLLKQMFLFYLEQTVERYEFRILSFCIMRNHYHLLINTPKANLSAGMQFLNSSYAMFYNNHLGRDGSIYKGRFKSLIIYNFKYLWNVSRYIHLNPCEAGLVKNAWDYEWSSCKSYLDAKNHLQWLSYDDIPRNSVEYLKYIVEGNDQKTIAFYSKKRIPNEFKI